MCLRTTESIKIAQEDIKCYKVVLRSNHKDKWRGLFIYNNKTFDFNKVLINRERKTVRTEDWWSGEVTFAVEKGYFHSFKSLPDADRLYRHAKSCPYDYLETKQMAIHYRIELVECVIPKGSEYFANSGYYASNKIIVKSE